MKYLILFAFLTCIVQHGMCSQTVKIELGSDQKDPLTVKYEILEPVILQNVAQFLDAFDFINVMLTSKKVKFESWHKLKLHLNQKFVNDFQKYFVDGMPQTAKIFNFFKVFCAYDLAKNVPENQIFYMKQIVCLDNFAGKNFQKCKAPLSQFVKTLQPGALKIGDFVDHNFLEYPNSDTVVFQLQISATGKPSGGQLVWNCKRFPIMIKYRKEEFVFHYCLVNHRGNWGREQRSFCYANANGKVKIVFDRIDATNPPNFSVTGAGFENTRDFDYRQGHRAQKIWPMNAKDMLLNALWCDVQQLEEFARIEQFKNSLRPTRIDQHFHNSLSFPVDGVLIYHRVKSTTVVKDTTLVWVHDKFPLVIRHKEKSYIFHSILHSPLDLYYEWIYETGTNAQGNQYVTRHDVENRKYVLHKKIGEILSIRLPKILTFPIDPNTFGAQAQQANALQDNFAYEKVNAVQAFKNGFWCDIRRIQNAINEFYDFQNENQ